jgi:hypothetical protein
MATRVEGAHQQASRQAPLAERDVVNRRLAPRKGALTGTPSTRQIGSTPKTPRRSST